MLFKDRGLTEKVTYEQTPEGRGSFRAAGGKVPGRGSGQGKGPEGGTAGGQCSWTAARAAEKSEIRSNTESAGLGLGVRTEGHCVPLMPKL